MEKEGGKERKVKEEGWKHHNIYQTLFSSYFSVGHPLVTCNIELPFIHGTTCVGGSSLTSQIWQTLALFTPSQ